MLDELKWNKNLKIISLALFISMLVMVGVCILTKQDLGVIITLAVLTVLYLILVLYLFLYTLF